ncbi:uncharacterized protein TRUGW13939_09881 [Talaromyces rugulosus]|uniref:Probable methionine--tRNA ligase, mitochondrial n=1 Tax=Talaromyces rugulosus TaxID=121627 RepID=A0A7H8R8J0_TALRU|nr:uncharacterized protein TRUGW13939_09881 [Talaromyces rugulosus]QKX62719.1 hypothetical protein TRUGW13939_09881 [Talaromyces rugulosus]
MATMRSSRGAFARASTYFNSGLPFTCRSYSAQLRRRTYATQAVDSKKPFYVTTPIFYVNSAPHVGHLYTMVLGDILKRWQLLVGDSNAQLLTGTDEHGIKIQQAAEAAGMETQAFCDMNCQTFKDLAKAANLKHDHFSRTTDAAHKDAVRYFWEMLQHRGYIYTSKHEGWYSISDEAFYPQSQVQPSLDPATGRKRMVSIETGKEVEWSAETNYHFKLSAFRDRLLQHFKENPELIKPQNAMENIVKSVESGLQDLSISRPVERLSWGIRVPGDESQTIYVWLDALVNYLTKAGYPFTPGKEKDSIWPANVQVVGKDIVRFHCVYWPAFLMALDLPVPRNVLVHSHWRMNQEKMSKSSGNGVNPFFAIDRFGVDTIRFFLTYHGPLRNDADYENELVARYYKKHLKNGFGNLARRVLGVTNWDLRPYFEAVEAGTLPEPTEEDRTMEEILRAVPGEVKQHMDNLDPQAALRRIMELLERTQVYFHNTKPWEHKKVDPSKGYRSIYNVCESLRMISILLQPTMPAKAAEILDFFGVDPSKRDFAAAAYGADLEYARRIEKNNTLFFPPLLVED